MIEYFGVRRNLFKFEPLRVDFGQVGVDYSPPSIDFGLLGFIFSTLKVSFGPLGVDFEALDSTLILCESIMGLLESIFGSGS